jgi:hypothetical protein
VFRVDSRVRRWGLYVTTCGESIIAPYRPIEHPPSHHFEWQHGRHMSDYQIVYVSEGTGRSKTNKAAFRVAAGDANLLFLACGVVISRMI